MAVAILLGLPMTLDVKIVSRRFAKQKLVVLKHKFGTKLVVLVMP